MTKEEQKYYELIKKYDLVEIENHYGSIGSVIPKTPYRVVGTFLNYDKDNNELCIARSVRLDLNEVIRMCFFYTSKKDTQYHYNDFMDMNEFDNQMEVLLSEFNECVKLIKEHENSRRIKKIEGMF